LPVSVRKPLSAVPAQMGVPVPVPGVAVPVPVLGVLLLGLQLPVMLGSIVV
jgi:hypothetical protein